jgi:hypothetical protein
MQRSFGWRRQAKPGSVAWPQRHGFMAATSWNRFGGKPPLTPLCAEGFEAGSLLAISRPLLSADCVEFLHHVGEANDRVSPRGQGEQDFLSRIE